MSSLPTYYCPKAGIKGITKNQLYTDEWQLLVLYMLSNSTNHRRTLITSCKETVQLTMQAGILCILNAKQFKIDVRFVSVSETQIQPDACRLI